MEFHFNKEIDITFKKNFKNFLFVYQQQQSVVLNLEKCKLKASWIV